jgi:hypothetical protein
MMICKFEGCKKVVELLELDKTEGEAVSTSFVGNSLPGF